MKNFTAILICSICSRYLFAQDASSYFPLNIGFKWNYKTIYDLLGKKVITLVIKNKTRVTMNLILIHL
jgi:hypothetical protein